MPFNLSICMPKVRSLAAGLAGAVLSSAVAGDALAALTWKGHTWNVTSGGMAGVAKGSPNNVSVDTNGYLHLKITNSSGTWTAAELFTTEKLGFGTYQWQIDGPIDRLDKNVVVGLFPYGPAAGIGGDGTNEIDIEYAFWGRADGPNGDFTNYPASGNTVGELSYKFSLNGGTLSTSRFIWTKDSIQDFLMSGLEPAGGTANLIKSWTYAPQNPTTNIPQQALPLGMNLWCFQAPPSDGQNVEIVVRDFEFVPLGSAGMGSGGAGGASGNGGTPGSGGAPSANGGAATASGGATAGSGGSSTANGGATNDGGAATANGGATNNGGASSSGGSSSSTGGVLPESGGYATNGGGTPAANGGKSATGSGGSESGGKGPIAGGMNEADGDGNPAAGCSCNLAPTNALSGDGGLLLAAPLLVFVRRVRKRRSV